MTEWEQAEPVLTMDLEFSAAAFEDWKGVAGSGELHLGDEVYPLEIQPGEPLYVLNTSEGTVYGGPVWATLITEEGPSTASLGLFFNPSQNRALVSAVSGPVGDDIFLAFGDPSFPIEELEELEQNG